MIDNNRRLCHKYTLKIGYRILWDKHKLENGHVKIN